MSQNNLKRRHWAGILYPESLPEDWRERVSAYGIPCAISPLHNLDTYDGKGTEQEKDLHPLGGGDDNNIEGQYKKPHYHIILSYPSPTTYNHVLEFLQSLGQPAPIAIQDINYYYAYLSHANAPDKAQYNADEIEHFCGFVAPRAKVDKDQQIFDIIDVVLDSGVSSFSQLVRYYRTIGDVEGLRYCMSHSYALNLIIAQNGN